MLRANILIRGVHGPARPGPKPGPARPGPGRAGPGWWRAGPGRAWIEAGRA